MDAEKIRILTDSGIDYEGGLDRFAGNEAMYVKFICRYPSDTHYSELLAALHEGDVEAGFRAAHTLKGVVGNLSFAEYFAAITPVAELLRAGNIDEAKTLMPKVEEAQARVMEALREV